MRVEMGVQALFTLLPMALWLDAAGCIRAVGPTLARLVAPGQRFLDGFAVQHPVGAAGLADLLAARRLRLRAADGSVLRGHAVPDGAGGALVNLSFGLGVVEAVRRLSLTEADFAPTELTVELLFLVEAKAAVTGELRRLNARGEAARSRAERQAQSDPLTGIGNRRALMAALEEAVAEGRPFGLLHLDLDHFKAVNDSLGHAAGDHVLARVAAILKAEMREGDTVARVGGDEFVALLPSIPDAARLGQVAARLVSRLAEPILFEGVPCRVAASIGYLVSGDHPGATGQALSARADASLYEAKRAGRGRAVLAPPVPVGMPDHAPWSGDTPPTPVARG